MIPSGVLRTVLLCGFCVLAVVVRDVGAADPTPPGRSLNFEDDIVPIFRAHCFACHGERLRKAGLDLRRRFAVVEGGESGSALAPGKPDDSLLVTMITEGLMPPEGEPPLNPAQIRTIREWVAGGAAIRGDREAPLARSDGGGSFTAEERAFWAFQPPARPPVPEVRAAGRVRTPVDAFLLAKLEANGAAFNADAAKRTLVRRVYFDLLGLPPAPRDVEAFLADRAPDAFERLVDRLLASPRYGERWGRHWLDVAGYADSDGYLAADRLRPEAYRYRDYVIRAFNSDKPFDRFVLEQVAGDELADWRRAKRLTPGMIDNLTATGFLRTALDPTYGNYKEPLECYKVMADTIQIVSSAFLGLTVQCARCHSHKSDPIPQSDYYRLHAVFLASYDPDRWQVSLARSIPLATDAERQRITKQNQAVDARVQELEETGAALTGRYRERVFDSELGHIEDAETRKQVQAALAVDEKKRSAPQKELVARWAAGVEVSEGALQKRFPEYAAELGKLQTAIAAEQALRREVVQLRGLMDLDDEPAQAHVLVRGDWNQPGMEVEPGVPRILTSEDYRFRPEPADRTTGRRLALARWLSDPRHPLTARVQVNRLWMHHFGRGIVATPDNFGRAGARPTHPRLLDYLATEFVDAGWSVKHLHRLIVTSTAYRQSSQPNRRALAADPDNRLLGSFPPRRLEGEIVRDAMLAVTGRLNRQMFGTPVGVERRSDGLVTVADSAAGSRASVYLIVRRSQPVTLLELFDTPRMEINCPQRAPSIVVTQALTLMNSRFTEAMAGALAGRVLEGGSRDRQARIDKMYGLLFQRLPSDEERDAVSRFLDAIRKQELASLMDPPSGDQVAAATRTGWQELAIVLLNCNEFLYVD